MGTNEELIEKLQNELSYQVRTAAARAYAAGRHGEGAPSKFVDDAVDGGKRRIADVLASTETRVAALEALLPGDEDREALMWREAAEYAADDADAQEDFATGWRTADRLSRGRDAEPEAVERTRKILNMLSLYADESNGAAYGTLNAAFVKANVEEALAALGGLPVEEVPEHGE